MHYTLIYSSTEMYCHMQDIKSGFWSKRLRNILFSWIVCIFTFFLYTSLKLKCSNPSKYHQITSVVLTLVIYQQNENDPGIMTSYPFPEMWNSILQDFKSKLHLFYHLHLADISEVRPGCSGGNVPG